jgi:hypothetical protein
LNYRTQAKQQELLRQNLVYQADLTLRKLVGRLLSAVSSSAAPAPAANIDSSSHFSAPAVPTAALGNDHDIDNARQWRIAVDRLRSMPRAAAANAANTGRQRVLAAIRANGMMAVMPTNGADSDPSDGPGSVPNVAAAAGLRDAALPSKLHLYSNALEQEFLRALEL